MKKIICIVLTLLMSVFGVNTPAIFAQSSEYVLKEHSEKVKIQSRAVFTENGLEADFAGGGFSVSLNCEGDVKLSLDWSGAAGLLGVIINEDFENASFIKVEAEGEQTITIAENLEKGSYKFEIIKQNPQATNQIVFKGLSFNGEMLNKPAEKDFKLQFIGDSISCGVGAIHAYDGDYFVSGLGDVYFHSFNVHCARKLNAEFSTCAIPGYGYLLGAHNGLGEDLYRYLDKAMFSKDIAYDNSKYIADVVVIELGVNDYNYVIKHKTIVEDKQADEVVQKYVDKIRSYNKDCYIILMGALGGGGKININNKSGGHYLKISNAVERIAAINEKVYFYQHPAVPITGWIGHPNNNEAKIIGENLANYITQEVLTGKESPDAIRNEDFYLNYDVNGDDKVSSLDVLFTRNVLVKKLVSVDITEYDCNLDTKTDVKDLLDMRKKIAELE